MQPKVKNLVIATLVSSSILVSGLVGWNFYSTTKKVVEKTDVVVAFSADPSVKGDQPLQLGYINHRFSVTCSAGKLNICYLETEIDGKSQVKEFKYVEQEWFNPSRSNRPYHTLDVIYNLPSFTGNPDLKFGKDPKSNAYLVYVMNKNGWVSQ